MVNIACFDVGGTFIKFAVITIDGEILTKNKFPSPTENCRIAVPEGIIGKAKELMKEYEIAAVAISTAGVVDSQEGSIIFATDNLPGYTGARLKASIEEALKLPVAVENDVNAAAMGELWMGAGKDRDSFLCLTLGTGIGGAVVINGKLYKGINNGAGEVGHIIIEEDGEPCTCGNSGCFERYASTSALIRGYLREAQKEGLNISSITGEEIMEKVKEEESLALKVYKRFLKNLVRGLVSLTHVLDPGLIVIGGGISSQGKPFFEEVNELFREQVITTYRKGTEIVPAKLKNDAGLYGACYLVLKETALL
ncbi:MAG: ROK family protein [Clostridiaceae bacterium]